MGAGMVGLSVAYQISKRYPLLSITIIEKESDVGMHVSYLYFNKIESNKLGQS
tara:strand:- start:657 stop:815 length:159 start_codon:yes stop_codon:yes gene_type:complete